MRTVPLRSLATTTSGSPSGFWAAGMNFFDSAEQYPGHHRALGRALKGLDRKSFFVTTKLQVEKDTSKEGFLKRARKSLEELGLDFVDCLMMHCPEKADTLKTEGFRNEPNSIELVTAMPNPSIQAARDSSVSGSR